MAERQLSLTKRELAILRRVATGDTNDGIAAALGISKATLRVHLAAIGKKADEQLSAASMDDGRPPMSTNGPTSSADEPTATELARSVLRNRDLQPNHSAS